jgi:hypothetical protein
MPELGGRKDVGGRNLYLCITRPIGKSTGKADGTRVYGRAHHKTPPTVFDSVQRSKGKRPLALRVLLVYPVALLVFLAAAAGARIVATYFIARPPLRGWGAFAASRAAGRGQFAFFLTSEFLLELINGG